MKLKQEVPKGVRTLFSRHCYHYMSIPGFPEIEDVCWNPHIDALFFPTNGDQMTQLLSRISETGHRRLLPTRTLCYMRFLVAFIYEWINAFASTTNDQKRQVLSANIRRVDTFLTRLFNTTVELHELFSLFHTITFLELFLKHFKAIRASETGLVKFELDLVEIEKRKIRHFTNRWPDFQDLYTRVRRISDMRISWFINSLFSHALNGPITQWDERRESGFDVSVLSEMFPHNPTERFKQVLSTVENLPYVECDSGILKSSNRW